MAETLDWVEVGGRFNKCRQENMPVQLGFEALEQLDDEAVVIMARTYAQNL